MHPSIHSFNNYYSKHFVSQFQHWEHGGEWADAVPDLFGANSRLFTKGKDNTEQWQSMGGYEEGFGEENTKRDHLFHIRLVETAFESVSLLCLKKHIQKQTQNF